MQFSSQRGPVRSLRNSHPGYMHLDLYELEIEFPNLTSHKAITRLIKKAIKNQPKTVLIFYPPGILEINPLNFIGDWKLLRYPRTKH